MAKIAYVLPYLETGGTEQHVLNLARALKDRHSLTLVAPPGPLAERFAAEGIRQVTFPRFDRDLSGGLAAFRRAIQDLSREGTDLFHVHAAIELALLTRLRARRTPLVFTVHGFFGTSASLSYRLAVQVANRVADRVICVSGVERERLVGLGLRANKAVVVWNGVPEPPTPAPADLAAFRHSFGLPGEDGVASPEKSPVIGALGRLEQQKGLQHLVEAGARLGRQGLEPRLLFIGDGSKREALRRQAKEAGVRALFTGFLGERERNAVLTCLDVFAMPSLGEALPLALIEAMSYGLPIVATTVGGIPEIVEDGVTGLLVAPGDAAALTDRLARLVRDEGLRRRLGEAARRFFGVHLTHTAMAEGVERIYEALFSSADGGGR